VRAREERAREAAAKPAKEPRAKPKTAKSPARPGSTKEQERLERDIEAAEAVLKALEDELADPAVWSTPQRTAQATARHDKAKRTVDELYARWERLAG
jgi:ATP-binding cassette subfamily F protein 3